MANHALRHEITTDADIPSVRKLLTTVDGIARWIRGEIVSLDGGQGWQVTYMDGPLFKWKLSGDTETAVTWECQSGPGDAAGTIVTFELVPLGDGRTRILFTHSGWPHQEGSFAKCNALWGMLLHHLREVAAKGKSAPLYS